jgi:hypothetical protein
MSGSSTPEWVEDQKFAELLFDIRSLRLVFLQACESSLPNRHPAVSSMAMRVAVMDKFIPAVVALQYRMEQEAARLFAENFYRSLLEPKPIDAAIQAWRAAMAGGKRTLDFVQPVLYLRQSTASLQQSQGTPRAAVHVQSESLPGEVLAAKNSIPPKTSNGHDPRVKHASVADVNEPLRELARKAGEKAGEGRSAGVLQNVEFPRLEETAYSSGGMLLQLLRGMPEDDLTDLCFELFREVYNKALGQTHRERVRLLVTHVEGKEQHIRTLLDAIKEWAPTIYQTYASRITVQQTPAQG